MTRYLDILVWLLRLTMSRFWLITLLLFLSCANYAAHITDKLLAGMYAEPSIENAPIQLLPSGTPVELKTEKDGFVKVQLVDGKEGWVEKRFLSDDKPANVRLLALQSKYRQQQSTLDAYEKELVILKKADTASEKIDKTQANTAIKKMKAELIASKNELALLNAKNKELASEIEKLQGEMFLAVPNAVEEKTGSSDARMSIWLWLLLVSIGIAGGRYWGVRVQDERQRKKHGGFRV